MRTTDRSSVDPGTTLGVWALRLAAVLLAAALGYAVWSLPATTGLGGPVRTALPESGVDHPVTAVLLNFRGYDTLLEMTVLMLSLLGIRALGVEPRATAEPPGPVLSVLMRLLAPFLVLFAGYLLWAGSNGPGGAFQAGAMLAAAGVLITLTGHDMPVTPPSWISRLLLALGLAVFAGIGLAVMAAGRHFLEYSPQYAKALILVIESAAAVSIGLTLLAAFRGGSPLPPGERT